MRQKYEKYFSGREKNLQFFFEKSGYALPHKTKFFATTKKSGQTLQKSTLLRRERKSGQ
jgi:hypothetical protein